MDQKEVTKSAKKGCLVSLSIAVLAIGLAVLWFWNKYDEFQNLYTAKSGVVLSASTLSDTQSEELNSRIDKFITDLNLPEEATLSLTQDELNYLIEHDPAFALFHDKLRFELKAQSIHANISLPLTELGLKDRYLNGLAELKFTVDKLQPYLTLESVMVNGRELPYRFMSSLKKLNLFTAPLKDPKSAHLLKKIRTIEVLDQKIIVHAGKTN